MKVKAFYWHECDRQTALKVIRYKLHNAIGLPSSMQERLNYLNEHCLRGIRFKLEEVLEGE